MKCAKEVNEFARKKGIAIINEETGDIINKNAKFDLTKLSKGAEQELWNAAAYNVMALSFKTPLLMNVNTTVEMADNDTVHVATITAGTPTVTEEGSTPNNSDSAFSPGVVDINTKDQVNVRWSITQKQKRSMSFNIMSSVIEAQKLACYGKIENNIFANILLNVPTAHRQERANGDAMTAAFFQNAWQYLLDDGADATNLLAFHDPATNIKTQNIAEATSGNLFFLHNEIYNGDVLKNGIIARAFGFDIALTGNLSGINDTWAAADSTHIGTVYIDKTTVVVGIDAAPSITMLPVLENPGEMYNMQIFFGKGFLKVNGLAAVKMYEA